MTCVGALACMNVRMAGATPNVQVVKKLDEEFEIVSLVGTVTTNDCHLHVAGSNTAGTVIGGHLKNGSLVGVTAEIVIGEDDTVVYQRVMDNETGFKELEVKKR